jgi:hypothetical protein
LSHWQRCCTEKKKLNKILKKFNLKKNQLRNKNQLAQKYSYIEKAQTKKRSAKNIG